MVWNSVPSHRETTNYAQSSGVLSLNILNFLLQKNEAVLCTTWTFWTLWWQHQKQQITLKGDFYKGPNDSHVLESTLEWAFSKHTGFWQPCFLSCTRALRGQGWEPCSVCDWTQTAFGTWLQGQFDKTMPWFENEASFNQGTSQQNFMKETARSLLKTNLPFFIALH